MILREADAPNHHRTRQRPTNHVPEWDHTQMLDTDRNMCQSEHITAPVSSNGGADAGLAVSTDRGSKTKHGGPRPGSGRPKVVGDRPWDLQGISSRTYYRRIKPTLPTQISYATDALRWFCIRLPYLTDDGVSKVNDDIRGRGFETFFPQEWVAPVAAHRTEAGRAIPARPERLVPLLRSYALVRFDRTDQSWRELAEIGKVLGSAEWPTPIPDGDIAKLRAGLADDGVLYPDAPEAATVARRKWVDMATALAARAAEMEAV